MHYIFILGKKKNKQKQKKKYNFAEDNIKVLSFFPPIKELRQEMTKTGKVSDIIPCMHHNMGTNSKVEGFCL
jgi:hypothetical protein